jgi:hypothetical protein
LNLNIFLVPIAILSDHWLTTVVSMGSSHRDRTFVSANSACRGFNVWIQRILCLDMKCIYKYPYLSIYIYIFVCNSRSKCVFKKWTHTYRTTCVCIYI